MSIEKVEGEITTSRATQFIIGKTVGDNNIHAGSVVFNGDSLDEVVSYKENATAKDVVGVVVKTPFNLPNSPFKQNYYKKDSRVSVCTAGLSYVRTNKDCKIGDVVTIDSNGEIMPDSVDYNSAVTFLYEKNEINIDDIVESYKKLDSSVLSFIVDGVEIKSKVLDFSNIDYDYSIKIIEILKEGFKDTPVNVKALDSESYYGILFYLTGNNKIISFYDWDKYDTLLGITLADYKKQGEDGNKSFFIVKIDHAHFDRLKTITDAKISLINSNNKIDLTLDFSEIKDWNDVAEVFNKDSKFNSYYTCEAGKSNSDEYGVYTEIKFISKLGDAAQLDIRSMSYPLSEIFTRTIRNDENGSISISCSPDISDWKKNSPINMGLSVEERLNFNKINISSTEQFWVSSAYGNNIFVAISYNSDVYAYSTDGIDWTEGKLPISDGWNTIIFSNGMFIIFAERGRTLRSTNGVDWTEGELPLDGLDFKVECAAYGNGVFVAIGQSQNNYFYSTDGIDWTKGDFGEMSFSQNSNFISIIFADGKFVAVGRQTLPASEKSYSICSTNGIDWTEGELPLDGENSPLWCSIAFCNGLFVATAMGTDVYAYSTNGIDWTMGKMPFVADWCSIAGGNGIFLAITEDTTKGTDVYAYSTNGIDWTMGKMPEKNKWGNVNCLNGIFITLCAFSDITAYSNFKPGSKILNEELDFSEANSFDDIENKFNTTFNQEFEFKFNEKKEKLEIIPVNALNLKFDSVSLKEVLHIDTIELPEDGSYLTDAGNGLFIVIKIDSNISFYSADGKNWTKNELPISAVWRDLSFAGGMFFGTFYGDSKFIYSYNGIDWLLGELPTSGNWKHVVYGSGIYLMICGNSDFCARSIDGINWTIYKGLKNANWESMAYYNGMFVIVPWGVDDSYAYSYDGITWINGKLPYKQDWHIDIGDYNGGRFVAVAWNSNGTKDAIYSDDGRHWVESSTATKTKNCWATVAHGNHIYLINSDNGYIEYSYDGINWECIQQESFSFSIRRAEYRNGKFIMASDTKKYFIVDDEIKSIKPIFNISYTIGDSKHKKAYVNIKSVSKFDELTTINNGWLKVEYNNEYLLAENIDLSSATRENINDIFNEHPAFKGKLNFNITFDNEDHINFYFETAIGGSNQHITDIYGRVDDNSIMKDIVPTINYSSIKTDFIVKEEGKAGELIAIAKNRYV